MRREAALATSLGRGRYETHSNEAFRTAFGGGDDRDGLARRSRRFRAGANGGQFTTRQFTIADVPLWRSAVIGQQRAAHRRERNPGMAAGAVGLGLRQQYHGHVGGLQRHSLPEKQELARSERNWLQLDINYILNGDNRFFIRGWVVYEPRVSVRVQGPAHDRHVATITTSITSGTRTGRTRPGR